MEFVAQPEKSDAGEYGSVSVVDSDGNLIDLAVTTNYRMAKIFKDLLDAAVASGDQLLVKRLHSELRTL